MNLNCTSYPYLPRPKVNGSDQLRIATFAQERGHNEVAEYLQELGLTP